VFKVLYNPSIKTLQAFLKAIYGKYEKALNETLKRLKAPSKPTLSRDEVEKEDFYIVVYRCQRSFVKLSSKPFIFKVFVSLALLIFPHP
jgi:hypothetical protein